MTYKEIIVAVPRHGEEDRGLCLTGRRWGGNRRHGDRDGNGNGGSSGGLGGWLSKSSDKRRRGDDVIQVYSGRHRTGTGNGRMRIICRRLSVDAAGSKGSRDTCRLGADGKRSNWVGTRQTFNLGLTWTT